MFVRPRTSSERASRCASILGGVVRKINGMLERGPAVGLGGACFLRACRIPFSPSQQRRRFSMKRKRWVAFLVFSLSLAVLTVACREKEATPAPDTRAEDERALRDSDAQWSKAAGAKDVEGFVSFFADDSSAVPPNASMVPGKEA